MSHLRDVLAKYDDLLYPEDEDQVLSFAEKELPEHKCQFILRKAGKTNSSNAISIGKCLTWLTLWLVDSDDRSNQEFRKM